MVEVIVYGVMMMVEVDVKVCCGGNVGFRGEYYIFL